MSIIIDNVEYYGIIYKIENTMNNHVYIGQTTDKNGINGRYSAKGSGIERIYNYHISRKRQGVYYNKYLLGEIEKYGMHAFVVDEVLDTAMTQIELNYKETYYIEQFDSYLNGYNMTLGGTYEVGHKMPSGKDSPCSKPVCQISPNGELIKIWDSLSDAATILGLHKGAMSNVCVGRKETSGGFVWVYKIDYDPNLDYSKIPKTRGGGKATAKPVILLDCDSQIVCEFASVVEAGLYCGISKQEVSRICSRIRKKPKYNLMFKSEYIEEQRLNVEGSYDVS